MSTFFIITGLPFVGEVKTTCSNNKLLKQYGIDGKLKRSNLFQAFISCKDKQDLVKHRVVYLVEGLLFSKASTNLIRPEILALVGDITVLNKVAWGRLSWGYMAPKLKECIVNKRSNFTGTYAVKGFYETLVVFSMKCILELAKVGVERIGNRLPRILNWKMGVKSSFGTLAATLFK